MIREYKFVARDRQNKRSPEMRGIVVATNKLDAVSKIKTNLENCVVLDIRVRREKRGRVPSLVLA